MWLYSLLWLKPFFYTCEFFPNHITVIPQPTVTNPKCSMRIIIFNFILIIWIINGNRLLQHFALTLYRSFIIYSTIFYVVDNIFYTIYLTMYRPILLFRYKWPLNTWYVFVRIFTLITWFLCYNISKLFLSLLWPIRWYALILLFLLTLYLMGIILLLFYVILLKFLLLI